MHRNNRSRHFEVTSSTGDTWVETCRDSLGGWVNLTARVAATVGADRLTPVDSDGTAWVAAGVRFTFAEVSKL